MRGIVASGHTLTSRAAAEVLADGGSAFDAAVAGLAAACVAEPLLASLGGGGFLMAETAEGDQRLFDFFSQTPRLCRPDAELFPIEGDFGSATQEFHIGAGAIAVPGMVRGLFHVHETLCRLPFARLTEFAIESARDGVEVNPFQARIAAILRPIVSARPGIRAAYFPVDRLIEAGDRQRNPDLGRTLEALTREGPEWFYCGEPGQRLAALCRDHAGHLDGDDLAAYRSIERHPLTLRYRRARIATNPVPSSGGTLIAHSLKLIDGLRSQRWREHPDDFLRQFPRVMAATAIERLRSDLQRRADPETADALLADAAIADLVDRLEEHAPAWGGTTHLSVVDAQGNVAAATVSNGEGCGYLLPGTGIHLNNFLGEQDLMPDGVGHWPPDRRLSSMMAPTVVHRDDGGRLALGSGGSNRLRTAITQVLVRLLEMGETPEQAVTAPRMHLENDWLNLEPGFDPELVAHLERSFPNLRVWAEPSVYFGGVHVVSSAPDGSLTAWADARRGGAVIAA